LSSVIHKGACVKIEKIVASLWFSIYDFSFEYKGNEPLYLNPADYTWSAGIGKEWQKIRNELHEYLKKGSLTSYFNNSMLESMDSWKTISLRTWGIEHPKNQEHFPFLSILLAQHPEIVSASFSRLEPHSVIKEHCGDTNAIVRCHLGLDIPASLPDCGFAVKGQEKAWANGEWLLFMDAYKHRAWNNTDKSRTILILDVLREEFKPRKWYVCSTVMTSLFLQRRAEKYRFDLFKRPRLIYTLARLLQPFSLIKIFAANALKLY
jgi:ornithine lipid ester-linked acyl 2-hydroxylase